MATTSTSRMTRQSRKRRGLNDQHEEEPPPLLALTFEKRKRARRRPMFVKPVPDPNFMPSELAISVMTNPVVLSKIAETLPASDAFVLRKTCRLWNRSLVRQLKKNHSPLKLIGLAAIRDRTEYIDVVRGSSSSEQQKLDLLPFSRYTLGGYFAHDCEEARIWIGKVMDVCAEACSSMSSLDLYVSGYKGKLPAATLRRIIFELIAKGGGVEEVSFGPLSIEEEPNPGFVQPLANLKKLRISQTSRVALRLANDVLQWAVKLEHLSIEEPRMPRGRVLPIVTTLQSVAPAQLHQLKTLKIAQLKAGALRILVDLARRDENPLRLECFAAGVLCDRDGHREETIRLLNEFLASQSSTLRSLMINATVGHSHQGRRRMETAIRIPRMERLSTFKLVRSDVWRVGIEYEQNSFVLTVPNLRRLVYQCAKRYRGMRYSEPALDSDGDESESDNKNKNDIGNLADDLKRIRSHPGVTELSLDRVPTECLERLGVVFPSVTRLEIDLNQDGNAIVHKIWTVWPALTTLCTCVVNVDPDSVLTGVPHKEVKNVRKELASLEELNLDGLRSLQSKYKTRPGLTDLHQLRQLEFEIFNASTLFYGSSYRVTNIGGYFALALAPQLQRIVIRGRGGRGKKPNAAQDLDSEL